MATEIQKPLDREPHENPPIETLERVLPNSSSLSLTEGSAKKLEESKETQPIRTAAPPPPSGSSPSSDSAPVTSLQKKIRRAERFGMPVQLSEEEKRNSRAERFGTVASSDTSKKSEEQKRKARAERFGLPILSGSDEEAKKKARLARFASVSKNSTAEEEKKKARAIRFSQTTSKAPSQANGKATSGKETSTVDKASGVA